jgi:hypothetical protein
MTHSKNLLAVALPVLIFGLVSACKTTAIPPANKTITSDLSRTPGDSLAIGIEALNLSEDLSRILSTKNDELLILIYEQKVGQPLEAPLFQQTLILDLETRKKLLKWKKDKNLEGKDLLYIMIEQDYDTPVEQIDPIVRIHHENIIKAFKKRDYQQLRTYLGTEDFLGFKILQDFSPDVPVSFNLKGVYKLDLYEYKISISPDNSTP